MLEVGRYAQMGVNGQCVHIHICLLGRVMIVCVYAWMSCQSCVQVWSCCCKDFVEAQRNLLIKTWEEVYTVLSGVEACGLCQVYPAIPA